MKHQEALANLKERFEGKFDIVDIRDTEYEAITQYIKELEGIVSVVANDIGVDFESGNYVLDGSVVYKARELMK